MSKFVGIDLGTTSISTVLIDLNMVDLPNHSPVLRQLSVNNDSQIDIAGQPNYSEWDLDRMIGLALNLLGDITTGIPNREIKGIGVTGQMHGMVLLDKNYQPCSNFIGWQDKRGHEIHSGNLTYVQRVRSVANSIQSSSLPSAGYMGTTLFWLSENGRLPANTQACFAPDYLVSQLCQSIPTTDRTNAASSGCFNITNNSWNTDFLKSLNLPTTHFPFVSENCSVAGTVKKLDSLGGIPVSVACGDNQASFAGSVDDPKNSILVNVGTGGQISAFVPNLHQNESLDIRPFLSDGYLLVGAGLCGGRSYRSLKHFVQQIGQSVFGIEPNQNASDLYLILNQLADCIPIKSEGLRCEPIFGGSRKQPDRRGIWSGISETNFTIGHFARSLLEGIANEFDVFHQQMKNSGLSERTKLVGSGNGIRRNKVLQNSIESKFATSISIPMHTEEAAVGAALSASVAIGYFETIVNAGKHFIRYQPKQYKDEY